MWKNNVPSVNIWQTPIPQSIKSWYTSYTFVLAEAGYKPRSLRDLRNAVGVPLTWQCTHMTVPALIILKQCANDTREFSKLSYPRRSMPVNPQPCLLVESKDTKRNKSRCQYCATCRRSRMQHPHATNTSCNRLTHQPWQIL